MLANAQGAARWKIGASVTHFFALSRTLERAPNPGDEGGRGQVPESRRSMKSWLSLHGGAGLHFAAAILAFKTAILLGGAASAASDFSGSSYARNVSLDANLDIYWTINIEEETIRLAVNAKSASGWVGVGISEMGGMEGADILYFETSSGNVTDAHALVAGTPTIDECTQDWTLLSTNVGDDGSLVFEAERALDTGDAQDRVFLDDTKDGVLPTRLIAAWGDTDFVSYHDTNFAKGEIVMFGEEEDADLPLVEIKESGNATYFDVKTSNFSVPEQRTWYEDTCIPASELPSLQEYHVIGFEGVLQSDTAEYVHHLVLTGWYGPGDCGQACSEWMEENFPENDGAYSGSTAGSTSFPSSYSSLSAYAEDNNITVPSFCEDYNFADIFAWAPGASSVELPTDVGFRVGNASSGFHSLSLQTHYDNPNGDVGKVDSSGVRVYYTEELRPIDMGVMKLGDPDVVLEGNYLPDGKYGMSFGCPGSCTEDNFQAEEVTMFYHFLHMHENGQTMRTRQYRTDDTGEEVLLHTAEVQYYSFLQAGGFSYYVNDSATIQKGDRFETECYYDTALSSVGSDNVTFGLGSEQEMCVDYVYYYPDQKVPDSGSCGLMYCGGSVLAASELSADSDFNRTFGMVDTCDATTNNEVGSTPAPTQARETPAPAPSQVGNDASSSPRPTSPGLGLVSISTTVVLAFVINTLVTPGVSLAYV